MPVVIANKNEYTGSVTPSALNTETTVVEFANVGNTYITEGYINLGNMASGDTVIITEYIAVDGVNYSIFDQVTFQNAQPKPVIRFHAKTFTSSMKHKVTINQTAGTLRSFPYSFVQEIMGMI
jgi:hypothetical protein